MLDYTTVKFAIWDTAGEEWSHSLAPMYYRGAQAAIVVYDITNQVSQIASCRRLVTCDVSSRSRWRWRHRLSQLLYFQIPSHSIF